MKIVIDIPEWKYKSICEGVEASKRCGVVGVDQDIHEAIYSGTVLPKGHGRLIDADAYIEKTAECNWLDDIPVEEFNKITPTIIEADKET